jgi:hypothetical protein
MQGMEVHTRDGKGAQQTPCNRILAQSRLMSAIALTINFWWLETCEITGVKFRKMAVFSKIIQV